MVRLISLALAATCACGGKTDTAGSASVTGTVSGRPVLTDNAMTIVLTTTTQAQTITSWTIDITTYAHACGCSGGANVQNVTLVIGALGTTIPTGKYSFGVDAGTNPQGAAASAHYYLADPSLPATLVDATSGSVDISLINASIVAGDFDISLSSGDHLTGTFSAPTCAVATPAPDAGACQ